MKYMMLDKGDLKTADTLSSLIQDMAVHYKTILETCYKNYDSASLRLLSDSMKVLNTNID